MNDPQSLIGLRVLKKSGKPFKSTFRLNTVKGVIVNEQDPKKRLAFTFLEDDSVVNVDLCNRYFDLFPTVMPSG